tara:strand:- start:1172 stop:2548 length:1377 start_codon:yes stop_codon:yes gene_type:complete
MGIKMFGMFRKNKNADKVNPPAQDKSGAIEDEQRTLMLDSTPQDEPGEENGIQEETKEVAFFHTAEFTIKPKITIEEVAYSGEDLTLEEVHEYEMGEDDKSFIEARNVTPSPSIYGEIIDGDIVELSFDHTEEDVANYLTRHEGMEGNFNTQIEVSSEGAILDSSSPAEMDEDEPSSEILEDICDLLKEIDIKSVIRERVSVISGLLDKAALMEDVSNAEPLVAALNDAEQSLRGVLDVNYNEPLSEAMNPAVYVNEGEKKLTSIWIKYCESITPAAFNFDEPVITTLMKVDMKAMANEWLGYKSEVIEIAHFIKSNQVEISQDLAKEKEAFWDSFFSTLCDETGCAGESKEDGYWVTLFNQEISSAGEIAWDSKLEGITPKAREEIEQLIKWHFPQSLSSLALSTLKALRGVANNEELVQEERQLLVDTFIKKWKVFMGQMYLQNLSENMTARVNND